MKNTILTVITLFALITSNYAATPITPALFGQVELPAGTIIYLETNEKVTTAQATVGQLVQFRVRTNVVVNGKVVIVSGALAIGRIKSLSEATFNDPAEVTIELTSVQAVDGQQVVLNGIEQTIKGKFPNEGTIVNIGTAITSTVMNNIKIKV